MANKINVVLGLDSSGFVRGLNIATKRLDDLSKRLESAGQDLTTRLSLPLAGIAAASLSAFAELDKFTKGLAAVMGSSEGAEAELVKLREVAKLPGLGFQEAVQGSTNLQAVGLSADQARQTLQGFGAAIAATGGGAAELGEVQKQLTQIISKNRILQEDYGVLQERIPLIGKALKAAFGTENIEQVREAGVTGRQFVDEISKALIVLPQTQNLTGGLANSFENFGDSARVGAARLGEIINESLGVEAAINGIADAINGAVDFFGSLNTNVQKTVIIFAAVVAGIGPLLLGIGALVKVGALAVAGHAAFTGVLVKIIPAIKAFAAGINLATIKITLIVGAVLAVVAGLLYLYNNFETVRRVVNGVIDTFVELFKILKEGAGNVFKGLGKILAGEFTEGGKLLADGLIKVNPVGIALTQGKRLGEAFNKGYEDETNRLGEIQKKIEAFFFKEPIEPKITPKVTAPNTDTGGGGTGGGGGGGGGDTTVAIKEDPLQSARVLFEQKRLKALAELGQKTANETKEAFDLAFRSIKPIGGDVISPIEKTREALAKYSTQIKNSEATLKIFGATQDEILRNKISLTESSIASAVEAFGSESAAVQDLTDKYLALKAQLDIINQGKENQIKLEEALGQAIGQAGQIIGQSLEEQGLSFKTLAQSVLQAAKTIIKALIQEGVAGFIKNILAGPTGKTLPPPVVLGIAAAGGAIASGIFSAAIGKIGVPKLARGGLVTGEQLAIVGDNPSGKEAIIPFERMGEFLDMAGGGSNRLSGLFEVRGQDLVLVLERANQSKNRIR